MKTGMGKSKRAFTLIELLVVIAIIAILMAIMSPVFVAARGVFQRYTGSNAMRQIALMTSMYAADHDEVLMPYRNDGWVGGWCNPETQCINPDYVKAYKAHGPAQAQEWYGHYSRDAQFYYQVLWSYGATERLFRSAGNPRAWTGADKTGQFTDIPEYRSYGAQNSYGVNWYLFTNPKPYMSIGGGLSMSQIDRVSATAYIFDATYYVVFPKNPMILRGDAWQTSLACSSIYKDYWKALGNSVLYRPEGIPSDTDALTMGKQRWSGYLNVISLDSSAHARKYVDVLTNLEHKGADSYWDPYKLGADPCPQ